MARQVQGAAEVADVPGRDGGRGPLLRDREPPVADARVDGAEDGAERARDGTPSGDRPQRDGIPAPVPAVVPVPARCPCCAGPVPRAARGRPRTYCSRACRQRAYRARRADRA
ncbi:hypothetical protein GCM10009801_38500 [Streptomyces albiaxialis]|uniref:Uncharacterized protein n=1 Tax=Streptomyces albiaxialis TaxID=329523 RepID=A0ABN2W1M3_9ACTN